MGETWFHLFQSCCYLPASAVPARPFGNCTHRSSSHHHVHQLPRHHDNLLRRFSFHEPLHVFIPQGRPFDLLPARVGGDGDLAAGFAFDLDYEGDLVSLRRLQKPLEFFIGQSCITDNISHGDCIDGIMARNRDNSDAVRHDNMFSLTSHPETRFFQGPYRIEVIDPDEFRQNLVYFPLSFENGSSFSWRRFHLNLLSCLNGLRRSFTSQPPTSIFLTIL
uniref:Uncharacterized protein n=1 Tax=Candidatus Kentrum sp. TC TaxID=2126339 RepID=A0A450YRV2_9GAMM|nr:MAG: hypothetical protein BECKTC1821E_GA0114239_103311 [Candidatus Kentron sp. TC]VFK60601.1 MAG: hypothetical protein BECKTC1821F_GA0114240_104710 [Candidatus Kentron sp. TC]